MKNCVFHPFLIQQAITEEEKEVANVVLERCSERSERVPNIQNIPNVPNEILVPNVPNEMSGFSPEINEISDVFKFVCKLP